MDGTQVESGKATIAFVVAGPGRSPHDPRKKKRTHPRSSATTIRHTSTYSDAINEESDER